MKLLIAYDGSGSAEAAIDDLLIAGLPPIGSAHVLSVAEVWLPPADAIDDLAEQASSCVEAIVREHREKGEKMLAEASIRAKHAEGRVRAVLPHWDVASTATFGSPTWEILGAAEQYGTELIVVGSQGHSSLNRSVLGSISQMVLTEAKCSVRVARGKHETDRSPERIIIGFDGSRGASAAVDAVAGRIWRAGAEVTLLSASEPLSPSSIGRFISPITRAVAEINVAEEHWIGDLADAALAKLRDSGIKANFHIHPGNPKSVLVQEAERWGADCIFLGANAWGNRLARVLLGSTASAVVGRAHCSVEAVRVQEESNASPNGHRSREPWGLGQ